jgi:hypothetical protein
MVRKPTRSPSLVGVLLLVIPMIWVLLACLGLALCRLAARSDSSQGVRLHDLLAAGYHVEHERLVADRPSDEIQFDHRRRATG